MHISLTGANLLSQLDVTLPFNPIEGVFSIIKREFYNFEGRREAEKEKRTGRPSICAGRAPSH